MKYNFNDVFNMYFGEPTTRVLEFNDLISYLDEVIYFAKVGKFISIFSDEINCNIERFVITDKFEKAIRKLVKNKEIEILNEIKEVLLTLENRKTTLNNIKLANGKIIFYYKLSSNIAIISLEII